jgi:hypothetical protein
MSRLLLLPFLAATATLTLAQTDAPTDATLPQVKPETAETQPPQHYWLRVTGDRVNLRSRPDTNSTIITKLNTDDVLAGHESLGEWQRVKPPRGVFSYVHRDYIRRDGDTGTVTVSSGNLRVRTGSTERTLDPYQSEAQILLPNGTAVEILGTQGDWLKIVPPDDVWMYVSADFVEEIPAAEARTLLARAAAREESIRQRGLDLTGAWGQRLKAVEQQIDQIRQQPLLEQNWQVIVEMLGPISRQDESPGVARVATRWIAQLQQRMRDIEAYRQAQALRAEQAAAQESDQRAPKPQRDPYAARGQLLESLVVAAQGDTRLFKLRDPLSRKVIAYLELPADSPIDPKPLLGRYVGVVGASRSDSRLGTTVIRVEKIEPLAPARRDNR